MGTCSETCTHMHRSLCVHSYAFIVSYAIICRHVGRVACNGYQTAALLFEVIKGVNLKQSIEVDRQMPSTSVSFSITSVIYVYTGLTFICCNSKIQYNHFSLLIISWWSLQMLETHMMLKKKTKDTVHWGSTTSFSSGICFYTWQNYPGRIC